MNCVRIFGHSLTLVMRLKTIEATLKLIHYHIQRRQLNMIRYVGKTMNEK